MWGRSARVAPASAVVRLVVTQSPAPTMLMGPRVGNLRIACRILSGRRLKADRQRDGCRPARKLAALFRERSSRTTNSSASP